VQLCLSHGLRAFENRVPRGRFGLCREEVTVSGTKIYNEELYELYFSLNIIKMTKSLK
jgi:hypothetical protein